MSDTDRDHAQFFRDLERAAQHDAEKHAPETPRPGSRADAIERGWDPRDEYEDMR